MLTLLVIWAIVATLTAVALAILHFANPYPLVQIPDRGHRMFVVPEDARGVIEKIFESAGLRAFGTFTAGVEQTLYDDGITVIGSGPALQAASISFAVENPSRAALHAKSVFAVAGIKVGDPIMPDPVLGDKLVVLQLPYGWDIAYRLTGRKMPKPQWV